MKITKSKLKQIIKEELENVIQEEQLKDIIPKGAVRNPESVTLRPGKTYLARTNPNMPESYADLYVISPGLEVLAISSIPLTQKQIAALAQKQ